MNPARPSLTEGGFLPLSVLFVTLLYLAAGLSGVTLVLVFIGIIVGLFGQVTVNDAMVGKCEEWRARAYAARQDNDRTL